MNLDQLIATSLSRPQRNITGDLGPRCPVCSGLGAYLKLGGESGVTRNTTGCGCDGSGLDLVSIERMDRDQLWAQIHAIETKLGMELTSRYQYPNIKLSRQFWMEAIAWATADGAAVATTITETILFPNVTIPANYLQDSRGLRLKCAGKYSTLGSGTVSHVYGVRLGGVAGTLLCKTGTVTLLISMTNALFEMEVMIQTRINGAAATSDIRADGVARAFGGTAPTIGSATGAPAIAPMTVGGQTAPAAASPDLTIDNALSVTIIHGASSSSNTITGQHYTLESMN
jgi:hypothetical protein